MPNLPTDASATEPVRLRPELAGVPAYRAGRPAPEGAFKVSVEREPLPTAARGRGRPDGCDGELNRYPDFASSTLVARLAERFAVPATHLAVGTGSVGVCQQIVQSVAGPGDEVVFAWRSFEAYPIIVQIAGATSVRVPLRSDECARPRGHGRGDHRPHPARARLQPQQPDGHRRSPDASWRRSSTECPPTSSSSSTRPIASSSATPRCRTASTSTADRPNVAVLRTFSKAYGLAGLRVGFAVAHEPVAAALRKTAVPFGVNSLAQVAAVASLDAEDELLEARVESLVVRARSGDGGARSPGLAGARRAGQLRLAPARGAQRLLRRGLCRWPGSSSGRSPAKGCG